MCYMGVYKRNNPFIGVLMIHSIKQIVSGFLFGIGFILAALAISHFFHVGICG
jgi:hypothetical protein